ncbi:nucleotide pyrophosphohydrolase [Candidatus Peregrinibacteria bacterium CG10_big_fil_rev_8_21_14_0_10_49_16]|nr:MAG: nucleotide pyrophosphohydrolase [Candidatus Peregrinibacteria bacterium CG22_combo_CG10-13_8_21_14_all_49_11]PIR52492.1 MAG: nucleotide pyrophosphohydrolase [Candidatus Peregrinibacteria bacterium CG10_big_fil_rev_8_21_14_0_10_49_16]
MVAVSHSITQADEDTRIAELKQLVQEFCDERDWSQFHSPKELAIGIVLEASELLEHFRFLSDAQMQALLASPVKKQEVEEELADVFCFLLRFSQMYDIDLSEALRKKMRKNAEKYPVEKAKGKNKKYTEY